MTSIIILKWKVKYYFCQLEFDSDIYIITNSWACFATNFYLSKCNDLSNLTNLWFHALEHGLRTSNEGINQKYLKNWADVADKICFGRT